MNIILTNITYFNNESKTLQNVNVFTDGKKVMTDSNSKKFVKNRLMNGDKFIEKSKKIIDVPISDLLTTPLQDILKKQKTEIPLYFNEQETLTEKEN